MNMRYFLVQFKKEDLLRITNIKRKDKILGGLIFFMNKNNNSALIIIYCNYNGWY